MLREGLSLEIGSEVVVGPAEVEIDEVVYELNKHKFEAIESESAFEVVEAVEVKAKKKK